jgi:hypothetical protein
MWNLWPRKSKSIEEQYPNWITDKVLEKDYERLGSYFACWKEYRPRAYTDLTVSTFFKLQVGLMDEMAEIIERNKQ